MKRSNKRILGVLLALFMVAGMLFAFGVSVSAAAEGGMEFNTAKDADVYRMPEKLDVYPNTFEAWICLSDTITGRAGSILSNYIGSGNNTILFEVHQNGVPRFYAANAEGKTMDVKFTTVDVRTNDWVHLAVVREENAVVCYVNGAEAARKELTFVYNEKVLDERFVFGGDNRATNQFPFLGKIRSFAMYADALNADAIAASYKNGVDTSNKSLLAYYDLTIGANGNYIEDLSGNGNYAAQSTFDPASATAVTTAAATAAVTAATEKAPAVPSSPATLDVSVILAVITAAAGSGAVVFKKKH